MRRSADLARLRQLLRALGRRCRGPGKIYLVGGASALIEGWRASTVDIDIKLDPEPAGIFEAIAHLKNEMEVNIELASPDLFLPELAGWRERSTFVERHGAVDFYHYDFRAQALAKLARGHERDLLDVRAMIALGLVEPGELAAAFGEMRSRLIRYPAVDPVKLEERLRQELSELQEEGHEPPEDHSTT